MNSTSTHFVPPRRVGIYEPLHQIGMWGESFKSNISNGNMNTPSHLIIPNHQKLDNNLVPFFSGFIFSFINLLMINISYFLKINRRFSFLEIIFFFLVRGYFTWNSRNSSHV